MDWQAFSLELAKDVVRLGGKIECNSDPKAFSKSNRFVLNCAGLQADRVAIELGGKQEPSNSFLLFFAIALYIIIFIIIYFIILLILLLF